jgi:RND superfamily putative drug exporter
MFWGSAVDSYDWQVLARLARFSFRRRGIVVIGWVVIMFALGAIGWGAVGPDFRTDFTLPASETKEVFDFLEQRRPESAGFNGQIVFEAQQGIDDPAVRAAVEGVLAQVSTLEGVKVASPYEPAGAFQVSPDRTIAFAQLDITDRPFEEFNTLAKKIMSFDDSVNVQGLTIEYGGDIFYEFTLPASEALGILAAVVILLIAFGSVLAMGLPIGTAIVGLLCSSALIALASHLLPMPDFTIAMAAMIGLGVGIDYALFIVTRYREGLNLGYDPETATVDAIDTSGRAVLFAGATVIISLLGLFLVGLRFVQGVATACILAVLSMMVAAVTLLPALIGFVRHKIDVTTWRGAVGLLLPVATAIPAIIVGAPGLFLAGLLLGVGVIVASFFVPALRKQVPIHHHRPREATFWYRWSRFIQHRPWIALVAGLIPLLVLAIPLFGIRLGFSDTGNYPKTETVRRAYDLLSKGFGPGFNGPFLVLVQDEDGSLDPQAAQDLQTTLNDTPGVAFATAPQPLGDDAQLITMFAESAPQDEATTELVHRLRDDVIPASGIDAKVGGFSAANVDFADYLGQRLPWIIGSVLVLSFILLMIVFRSVLVPLKAVVMNLLSIGAAYGLIVAIFQWGWGKGLVDLDRGGPIESWIPMFLFAIVFGLSMDYEVFLLSRMKEEYDRTGDNGTAVADGLSVTARVITAAALIMVCVFASFAIGDDRQLKLFGLGMAFAVLIDATIVRMVLVPATMELLGDRNWWLPKWLHWLPRIHVEGKHHDLDAEAASLIDAQEDTDLTRLP